MSGNVHQKRIASFILIFAILSIGGLILSSAPATALGAASAPGSAALLAQPRSGPSSQTGDQIDAACSGGPVIDGVTLDECVDNTFSVGGTTKTVRVWYTQNVSTVQRDVDGTIYNLTHYINTDTEAQNVAQWGREAWERYYQVFGRHPYNNSCGDRINVQLEDGIGWAGIAYWASPGDCFIGIDSPMIRNGDGRAVVYHEFQHYTQYSFDSGCYAYIYANYDGGSAAGVAEFVEGYADLAMDTVTAALDATLYEDIVKDYNASNSFYDKGYWDVFNKYFSEQLGISYNPSDPHWHFDAVREHYEACDAADTLYVLDTLVPSLEPGLTDEELFLNFFATNWAKDWADSDTQPELVYFDDDSGPSYGSVSLYKNETISSGTKSWPGETTPDDWAARYYQVKPQSGCSFVTVNVDGAAGAHLGINLMAADTSAPVSVNRVAWIGEDLSRTFPAYGTYDRIVAVVNAFDNTASYDVSFSCVTPTIEILEPRQTNFALVGDPLSPISFLARFKVTHAGAPVMGLSEAMFAPDAEGNAISIVPGSLSQVSEEYWAIMLPPVQPAGTTYVDLRICLGTSSCDTENNALLYVDPGNTDFALVFDGSGSMDIEDVIGEGKRVENARKAGTVLADLLRIGDRILITDFSAFDNPSGCGLPYGDGDCELDIITRLFRTTVVDPAANAIQAAKDAIENITPREWTPIGAALKDAMDQLAATPANDNPKHIILLSDGEENVNPLYAEIRDALIASGVVVDTIRFSADAPGDLLAQIAADTGGSYKYVPTSSGSQSEYAQQFLDVLSQRDINSTLVNQLVPTAEQANQQLLELTTALGFSPDQVNQLMAETFPGPLGLDDVYDYYETRGQGAARLLHINHTLVPDGEERSEEILVDESVNTLRIVVAGKQADADHFPDNCGYIRRVTVLPPGVQRPYPISPANDLTPADWDIRNSLYDDVVIISNPTPGTWVVAAKYFYNLCAAADEVPAALETDFMINSSAETNLQLTARFLPPLVNNQAASGDYVPIVATLMDRNGAIKGGLVYGYVEHPSGGINWLVLWDDGLHNDGNADDGVYGNEYRLAYLAGSYNVRLGAVFYDPADPSQILFREWNGAFYMTGPEVNPELDTDKDSLPDAWELRCAPDLQTLDSWGDYDRDQLPNIYEFVFGTLACQADTDRGGEQDGSELLAESPRNPLYAPDDVVRPLGIVNVRGLNDMVRIQWTHPFSYTRMIGWIFTDADPDGRQVDLGRTGIYTDTEVTNDQKFYIRLFGMVDDALGEYSDPVEFTPKLDPDSPSGAFLINNGAPETLSKQVTLWISAADTPLDGMASPSSSSGGGVLAINHNAVSAAIEMRVSNDPTFAGAVWMPLDTELPWTLADGPAGVYAVFMQFRDAALNESAVVVDTILYTANISFIPVVAK